MGSYRTRKQYPLVINKTKWNQLQNSSGKLEEPAPQGVSAEYVNNLIALSKEWTKNWPDSVEGIVQKKNQMLQKKRNKEKEIIKSFKEREQMNKIYNFEHIEKARKMVFDNTCYGKQLTSAVLESKAIEEREAQIKFKAELKEKAKSLDRKLETKNTLVLGKEKSKQDILGTNKAFADFNKAIHEQNQRETAKENEKEKLLQLEDARNMKKLLDMEAHAMDGCKSKAIEDVKYSKEENKRVTKEKAIRQAADDAIVETWRERKYHERMRCKTRKTMESIIKEKTEGHFYRKNYALVKKLQDEEKKRYDDFIGKPVNIMDNMFAKDEEHELTNKIKAKKIMKENLIEIECKKLRKFTEKEECVRCSLYMPQREDSKKKVGAQHGSCKCEHPEKDSFLGCSTKLLSDLKSREHEPTPWTGLKGAHDQFAKHAAGTLQECAHKNMARKVVDEYRKQNCLDEKSLTISNY